MKFISGVLLVIFGVLLFLYIYTFASMIDPSLSDAEWRSELLYKMFVQRGVAEGTYVSIAMIIGGIPLVVHRLRRRN